MLILTTLQGDGSKEDVWRVVQGALSAGLKELVFLAHAPARTALDNLLSNQTAYTTVIYADRHAPGWKELRATMTAEERTAKPEGAWGVYQTASGKCFYIVQRDSPYGKRPGFMVILR